MKAKILAISIVFVLAMLPMAQADNIGGSVQVGSSDITISNVIVEDDDAVDPATVLESDTLFTEATVTLTNPNGWEQTELGIWLPENKTNAEKVRYGTTNTDDFSYAYEFMYNENANNHFDEIQKRDPDATSDLFDVKITCPTGNCSEEILLNTTGSDFNTEVGRIDLSGRTGNYIDLTKINISEDIISWGSEVTLTGGNSTADPQYTTFDYSYTDGSLGAFKDGRTNPIVLKNNESEYVLLAVESAENPDDVVWKYMISDTPDLSATTSNGYEDYGKLRAIGIEGRSTQQHYLNDISGNNDVNATEINSTTAEITFKMRIPLIYGATSETEINSEDVWLRAFQYQTEGTQNYTEYVHNYDILEYKTFDRIIAEGSDFDFGELKPTESSTIRAVNLRKTNVPLTLNVSATDFTGDGYTIPINNVELNETENIQSTCFTPSIYTMSTSSQEVRTLYPTTEDSCSDGSYGIPEEQFTLTLPSGLGIPTGTQLTNTFTWTIS